MSLIITSSKQDRYEGSNAIENPWSYKNYLGNSMKIKPHSEVAVQSVKINRSGQFKFHDGNKQAYIMVGQDIDPTKDNDIPTHRPTTCLPLSIKEGVYTPEELATQLTNAFTIPFCSHPDQDTPAITIKKPAGIFVGFDYEFKQKTPASKADAATDDDWFPRAILDNMYRDIGSGHGLAPTFYREKSNAADNITQANFEDPTFVPNWWNNATKEITRVDTAGTIWDGGGHSFTGGVFPQYPMSHQNGVFKVDISNCNDTEWLVSLTRPVAAASRIPEGRSYDDGEAPFELYGNGGASLVCPPWVKDHDTHHVWKFGDFTARSVKAKDGKHYLRLQYFGFKIGTQVDATGSANDLRPDAPLLYHNGDVDIETIKPDDPSAEVPYWTSTATDYGKSGAKLTAYDLDTNSLNFKFIQWKVDNERVIFSGIDAGGTETIIASYHQDNTTGFPSAGNPNRFTLYPKVLIRDTSGGGNTKSIKIDKYECRTDMAATYSKTDQPWDYGSDWYCRTIDNRVSEDLDRRPMNDVDWLASANNDGTDPIGCEVGGANANYLAYGAPYIMLGDDARIGPTFVKTPLPNMAAVCGFDAVNYIGGGNAAADLAGGAWDDNAKKLTFASAKAPVQEAEHSLFVRCPTLTQISQNFAKGAISKILYHIPQFTPDGRSTGALFFEPNEKTYIKLGNTETIDLNELQIDLVDKNENLAYELESNTIVVLHVR
jgi:hypothetical protein